ncbi:hypothetical protein B0E42_20480 [Pseudomonas sp. A25(2017)]|uniref:hypothetical protein n=1 Tax=Pseudomonas sp. A25(2017) TaxID=1945865 RepID=UPI0009858DD7|nr:hypothetical protein [Pseudomonas sp. A25(2017)]OOG83214.1 hypothetical protein B0E42_20480 [Pseudomonas sp. A25(2017)]
MTAKIKYDECMKARALAGMVLMEGVDAMLSVMPDSDAKNEVARLLNDYHKSVKEAREIRDAI